MIFSSLRVPVPEISRSITVRNNISYVYAYIGDRLRRTDGSSRPPKKKMIGRIQSDAQGHDWLVPNANYYQLTGQEMPPLTGAEGAGRKPKIHPDIVSERPDGSTSAFGYGLAMIFLATDLGLLPCLQEAFGPETAKRLFALAAYFCAAPRSSLAELEEFTQRHMSCWLPTPFDRRRAGELLSSLSSEARYAFYQKWIHWNRDDLHHVFYDVTSFSTYSAQIHCAKYGYNRDGEKLKQVNQGLFCARESGLPLFMTVYDGSLNDPQNFDRVLRQAHAVGLKSTDQKHLTLIVDGGFCRRNLNWAHLHDYRLTAGIPGDRLKEVSQAYARWANSPDFNEHEKCWTVNDDCYISTRVPFTMAGIPGVLVLCKNLTAYAAQLYGLTREKDRLQATLENTAHCPIPDFAQWAKGFRPFFAVERSVGRRGFTFKLDTAACADLYRRAGQVILFSTCQECTDQQLLILYRSKEAVENCFDFEKNGLCDKRLHVHGDESMEGRLFVLFIALIMRCAFQKRLQPWSQAHSSLGFKDAVDDLKSIKFIKLNGQWVLKDEISKEQRELIQALMLDSTKDRTIPPLYQRSPSKEPAKGSVPTV